MTTTMQRPQRFSMAPSVAPSLAPSVAPSTSTTVVNKDTDVLFTTKEDSAGDPEKIQLTFEDGSSDDPQVRHGSHFSALYGVLNAM